MKASKGKAVAKAVAIGYARVSTVGQSDGVSLDAQQRAIRDWASAKGFRLAGVHVDVQSGKRADNRKGLQDAISAACKAGGVLVSYSASRLARSTKDLLEIAERLNKCGADIASTTEPLDTTTAMGKAFYGFVGIMAELERNLISGRTTDALAHKRSKGERVSRFAPYGFRFEGESVVSNPTEQRTVKRIQTMRAKGRTYQEIADALEASGIRNRNGGTWRLNTIMDICKRAKVTP